MKIYYSLIVILILVFGGGIYYTQTQIEKQLEAQAQKQGMSSNSDAFAYQATTTDTTWNSPNGEKILKNGPGVLGSVNIPNSTAGTLCLYDGTTTQSHANYATTTLACFATNASANTYLFDVAFGRALVAQWSSTLLSVASSTISWK